MSKKFSIPNFLTSANDEPIGAMRAFVNPENAAKLAANIRDHAHDGTNNVSNEKTSAQIEQDVINMIQEVAGKPGEIIKLPLNRLMPCPEEWNFFSKLSNEKLLILAESIYTQGLLQPIVVRAIDSDNSSFQILAGHNRFDCISLLRMMTNDSKYDYIDARVFWFNEIDDEQAQEIVSDTNFAQRGNLSARDRAMCIIKKAKALKRRSIIENTRGDITNQLAEHFNLKKTSISYWKNIANLIPELEPMLDDKTLNLVSASKLASFPQEVQHRLYDEYKSYLSSDNVHYIKARMSYDEIVTAITFNVRNKKALEQESKEDKHIQLKPYQITVKETPINKEKPLVLYLTEDKLDEFLNNNLDWIQKNAVLGTVIN